MVPRRPAVKRDDQADEDRMASRLELMGKRSLYYMFLRYKLVHPEQVNNARKSDKPAKVDIFRSVSFDDWLRLFMQVEFA
jgi:general transcription factor 3C polypeptide 3 (transcription factor C subunit 4)